MAGVLLSSVAERDLADIWDYIARDNPDAADRLLCQIDTQARFYGVNPGLGTPYTELFRGLRSFAVGEYVGFYLPFAEGIRIVRILHRARDLPKVFAVNDGR